ncbi:hypothetical protein BJF80_00095 [Serinicoccus sp. CUA-874]|uniref:acyltransferase family protein n=1 Tax=Serinicoccus sp. CUA-874 TaxID=1517939 RepID=UPI000964E8A5|nr:acyltransferase family protein [Serinicoccus sp. CUA-874]OLT17778.1 hypothetical protein BJF80_00095 [Serinicoccus sp. CUA-874]
MPPTQRRLDIDGLRAVAALLVAIHHVWLGGVSGGVDVFFVVAGFMMTTTVLGHQERYGRLRPGVYAGRLMSRLLPQALLVLTVVAVATVALLPATSWRTTFREIAASAVYLENWELIGQSVDYLQRDAAASPVQHFWAMSVQGQFYVLWALLAVVAFRWRGRLSPERSLTVVIAAACAASFAFSLVLTAENQPVAYFHTLTRVWEFAGGGLVALAMRRGVRPGDKTSTAAGWLGLALIVSCGTVLPVQDTFPGWVALWPVTGAALILLAGQGATRATAGRLLSTPGLVRLGSVSYAIYLWHWPLLVLWLHVSDRTSAGLVDGATVIGLSVLLAFATTAVVERPLRSWASTARTGATVLLGATAVAIVAVSGIAASQVEVERVQSEGLVGAELLDENGRGDVVDLRKGNDGQPVPGVLAAVDDVPSLYDEGCATTQTDDEVITCEYGDLEADRSIVLTGGSHSAHWLPGLDRAAQQTGWRVLTVIKNGCRTGFAPEPGDDSPESVSCGRWNDAALPHIIDLEPDLVVMTSTISGREQSEVLPPSYLDTWAELSAHDIPVLAIRDTPRSPFDRVECLAEEGPLGTACDVERDTTLAREDPTSQVPSAPANVTFADLTSYFCDASVCPAVIGDAVVYSDRNHITTTYSRSLAPVLADLLEPFA